VGGRALAATRVALTGTSPGYPKIPEDRSPIRNIAWILPTILLYVSVVISAAYLKIEAETDGAT
jgi:hypothetical protein